MASDLDLEIEASVSHLLPCRLGVAVSGGGDSMALLVLLHRFAARNGCILKAVTVDHALRAGSDEEARTVAAFCTRLGVPHTTLRWSDWDGSGNLQDAARRARYRLIAEWASSAGVDAVALAHTQEDQAETVLMRLSRAAGVDGLSAMPAQYERFGIKWLRPLLSARRDDLRRFLQAEQVSWIEDPTNHDRLFERIRARQALDVLAPLGITVEALAQTAQNMASARRALKDRTAQVLRSTAQIVAGAVAIEFKLLNDQPEEIQRRAFLAILHWITGAEYGPRARALAAARNSLQRDGSATLDGCHMFLSGNMLWVCREYARVRDLTGPVGQLWDGRWDVMGPISDADVAALGPTGLAATADWRDAHVPRAALMSTPAVWRGSEMIAAPVLEEALGRAGAWQAKLKKRPDALFDTGDAH